MRREIQYLLDRDTSCLASTSLSWRGSPWTLCNNSSDWLDISLFGSFTPQVDTTGSLIRLPTGTLSGPSFLGVSFDHRVNKLVQHQHHPRALVVVPRLWLESNHWSAFWAISFTAFLCHASKGPFFLPLRTCLWGPPYWSILFSLTSFLQRQKANLGLLPRQSERRTKGKGSVAKKPLHWWAKPLDRGGEGVRTLTILL